MADLQTKLTALLKATSGITSLLGDGAASIKPNWYPSIGNKDKFPILSINDDLGAIDESFPATLGNMVIIAFVKRGMLQSYKQTRLIRKAVSDLLNFNTSGLSDTISANDSDSTKVRTAQFKRTSAPVTFDDELELIVCTMNFSYVLSEGESYLIANSGNKAWV